jgi:hypothetical protein
LGAGSALASAGGRAAQALEATGYAKTAQAVCGLGTAAQLAQPYFAYQQISAVASGLYGAAQAAGEGDCATAVEQAAGVGFNAIGLLGTLQQTAQIAQSWAQGRLWLSCFAAGTPLLTPEGSQAIEDFRVGDLVLARPEGDPAAAAEAKVVEEVFSRTGRVLALHVGGQVIKTTAEHPFWVQGKGWLAGGALQAGDLLSSADGQWVAVEALRDTAEYATVYNLRVGEYHTYFVGSGEWRFSVWAHNACVYQAPDPTSGEVKYVGVANRGLNKTLNQRLKAAEGLTGFKARVIQGTENLTAQEAEAVEQALIKYHGRQGVDPGGTLLNKSPGVNVNPRNTALGNKLLKKIEYPGFE